MQSKEWNKRTEQTEFWNNEHNQLGLGETFGRKKNTIDIILILFAERVYKKVTGTIIIT